MSAAELIIRLVDGSPPDPSTAQNPSASPHPTVDEVARPTLPPSRDTTTTAPTPSNTLELTERIDALLRAIQQPPDRTSSSTSDPPPLAQQSPVVVSVPRSPEVPGSVSPTTAPEPAAPAQVVQRMTVDGLAEEVAAIVRDAVGSSPPTESTAPDAEAPVQPTTAPEPAPATDAVPTTAQELFESIAANMSNLERLAEQSLEQLRRIAGDATTPSEESTQPEQPATPSVDTSPLESITRWLRTQANNLTQSLPKPAQAAIQRIRNSAAVRMAGRAVRRLRPVARRAMKAFGKTRLGRAAKGIATRASGWVSSALGRTAATTATTTAAGAGTAAAGAAAGTGAAAGAGAATGAGATVAAALGPVGIVAGVTVAGLAALVLAVKGAGDALHDWTSNLTEYSGALSAEASRRQVTTEVNMLNRADAIGPQMARIEASRTRFDDVTQKLWTQVLGWLVNSLGPKLETMLDSLTLIVDGVRVIGGSAELLAAMTTPLNQQDDAAAAGKLAVAIGDLQRDWAELVGGGNAVAGEDVFMKQFDAFKAEVARKERNERRGRGGKN